MYSGFNQIDTRYSSAEAPGLAPSDLSRAFTNFVYHGPGDYLLTINWQVHYNQDGLQGLWSFPGQPVSEWFDLYLNSCNVTLATNTAETNYYGRFQDRYGNYHGVNDPIPACTHGLPNCEILTSQNIQVLDRPFSHRVNFNCSGVTVER